jgi:iron uptake system component EfeO
VETELGKHRAGDGWKLHTQLTEPELKALTDVINAVAEPISKIAGVIAEK